MNKELCDLLKEVLTNVDLEGAQRPVVNDLGAQQIAAVLEEESTQMLCMGVETGSAATTCTLAHHYRSGSIPGLDNESQD